MRVVLECGFYLKRKTVLFNISTDNFARSPCIMILLRKKIPDFLDTSVGHLRKVKVFLIREGSLIRVRVLTATAVLRNPQTRQYDATINNVVANQLQILRKFQYSQRLYHQFWVVWCDSRHFMEFHQVKKTFTQPIPKLRKVRLDQVTVFENMS